jgi:hypothetical protein
MNKFLFIFFQFFLTSSLITLSAQSTDTVKIVYPLGEGAEIDYLMARYPTTVQQIVKNDPAKTKAHWKEFGLALEKFFDDIEFDVKGVKLMMHVCWSKEGKLLHIGFMFKDNSRNMKEDDFKIAISQFVDKYKSTLSYKEPFTYYGSLNFPSSLNGWNQPGKPK